MKSVFCLILLHLTYTIYAQGSTKDVDSLEQNGSNSYIENHKNQLNIKFDVSNDIENYFITFDNKKVTIAPNQNIRYALDFNYKFASVRLGIRTPISSAQKEDKGDTYVFRFKVKFLFNKWSHQLEYNYVRGYYIKNSEDILGENFQNHIQFPRLKTYIFSGSTAYKFNDNYSLRAVVSQTEIQTKSAGSFMPSIDYWIYHINGTKKITNTNGETIERDNYSHFTGFASVFNIGYYHTFVLNKYWYAHVYAAPGIGMDLYQTETFSPQQNYIKNHSSLITSIQGGAAIGYNTLSYYFGVAYDNKSTNENQYNNEYKLQTSRNVFHAFIGYRFKAPKQVKVPIEYLEKKIPILDR